MAGKSRKKAQTQNAKSFEDFDDEVDCFEEDVSKLDPEAPETHPLRSRDWRDVEKLRELRELRKLVGDDLDGLIEELGTDHSRSKKSKR